MHFFVQPAMNDVACQIHFLGVNILLYKHEFGSFCKLPAMYCHTTQRYVSMTFLYKETCLGNLRSSQNCHGHTFMDFSPRNYAHLGINL